jgi:xanthine/CO dehydrogenase XdhC/CoxF family maturation factor
VHLGIPALLEFFRARQDDPYLVLATIIGIEGSTYRKPGAMMLIGSDHRFEGMISGGCLEGDLLHHAADVFAGGEPKFVTYDMHAGDDLVWNLGLGCDGVIHLMLQRLERDRGFGFLPALATSQEARLSAMVALKIAADGEIHAGTSAFLDREGNRSGNEVLIRALQETAAAGWPEWRYARRGPTAGGAAQDIMLINVPPRVRVLICGAGPDAVPVARVLSGLDWEVIVVDHRPAYARRERFPGRCRLIQARPEQLADALVLSGLDAAVIMSHHLENDSVYLRQLAEYAIPYIGCLGPRARSVRLKEMAGCEQLEVHGPVGLDIGAELPEAIAISLAAEIHAKLNKRSGLSLSSSMKP